MQSAGVVDIVGESRQVGGDVVEGLEVHQVNRLDLESLDEVLRSSVDAAMCQESILVGALVFARVGPRLRFNLGLAAVVGHDPPVDLTCQVAFQTTDKRFPGRRTESWKSGCCS